MGIICEHIFKKEDPKNKGYSMTEYDLASKLKMSIRKNLKTGKYEIFRLDDKTVYMQGTLEEVVNEANKLEGGKFTRIECRDECGKK